MDDDRISRIDVVTTEPVTHIKVKIVNCRVYSSSCGRQQVLKVAISRNRATSVMTSTLQPNGLTQAEPPPRINTDSTLRVE